MKHLFGIMLAALVFDACTSLNYQVYEVKSELTQKDNTMVFENEDCKVSYNLWAKNGSMSFIFENKSDKDLFIDMSQTFFIKNGKAFDYYMNRTFETRSYDAINVGYSYNVSRNLSVLGTWNNMYLATASVGDVAGVKAGAQKGISTAVTVKEQEVICIPAKSYKIIGGYNINSVFTKTCDRNKDFPKKMSTVATYSETNSPLKFTNRIAYSFEESNKSLKFIENSFWVESIKNYTRKMAVEKVNDDSKCKGEIAPKLFVFKIGGPNQFYVTY